MTHSDQDPIQSVKAFLQGDAAAGSIAGDLREIRERLNRARQVDGRVSPSEALQLLLISGETPASGT